MIHCMFIFYLVLAALFAKSVALAGSPGSAGMDYGTGSRPIYRCSLADWQYDGQLSPFTKLRVNRNPAAVAFDNGGIGKGTGYGLANARNIVTEKHGGTIQLETSQGKGTTFLIKLPFKVT